MLLSIDSASQPFFVSSRNAPRCLLSILSLCMQSIKAKRLTNVERWLFQGSWIRRVTLWDNFSPYEWVFRKWEAIVLEGNHCREFHMPNVQLLNYAETFTINIELKHYPLLLRLLSGFLRLIRTASSLKPLKKKKSRLNKNEKCQQPRLHLLKHAAN